MPDRRVRVYASRWGYALIDRRLYLPKAWAGDPQRRAKAQVPEVVVFATKLTMACEMSARLLDEGIPCAFMHRRCGLRLRLPHHWARVPLKSQAEQARIFPLAARAEKPARSRRDCLSLHLRLL